MFNNKKGITLIALIITIIVLLILAGITISLTLGQNGIITRAQESAIEHLKAEIKEEIEFAILEIETDLKSNNIQGSLSNGIIIEKLPAKLESIIINADLIGEYKGYEYWIDEEYKVHVEGKINNPIEVNVTASYVGTSSCTINVAATSNEGNIVGYKYKINDEETEQLTQSEYTIENLEPTTKYTISVEVIDEKGNTKASIPVTITTKGRTYIIKDGVEQIQGQTHYISITQEDGYLKVTTNNTVERGAYYFEYDISKYKYVKIDTEVVNKGIANTKCLILLGIMPQNNDAPADQQLVKQLQIASETENTKTRQTYSLRVEELQGTYTIAYLKNATSPATSAIMDIYNLWLEE